MLQTTLSVLAIIGLVIVNTSIGILTGRGTNNLLRVDSQGGFLVMFMNCMCSFFAALMGGVSFFFPDSSMTVIAHSLRLVVALNLLGTMVVPFVMFGGKWFIDAGRVLISMTDVLIPRK